MKIYLAGPLFTSAERQFNTSLAWVLRDHGHQVWVPQDNEPRELTAQAIFDKDIEGIHWADVIVACMDGPDPDSGTAFECGYAYGRKPIIAFRTDFRNAGDAGDARYNLMLWASARINIQSSMGAAHEVAAPILTALGRISL